MADLRQKTLDALRRKVSELPAEPGVYLFKDAAGVVLYVGKANSLRPRVGSYLQPSADLGGSRGPEIARMIDELACDVDVLVCDSEVDALLRENRLIKDIRPRFNKDLRDDKTFPYLQIRTGEDFPRVEITREPLLHGARLFGPFVSPSELRAALPLVQRVFRFRTCKLDIFEADERRRFFRPCILHAIKQCTAPCGARTSKDDYRADIANLIKFLQSKGQAVARQFRAEMEAAAKALDFERAAVLRDQIKALEGLQRRGLVSEDEQPEVFFVDLAEGLLRLMNALALPTQPRIIECIDIAHLAGNETAGALVCYIDGRTFKSGYRRYKIRTAQPGDDYAAIGEVVARRYARAGNDEELFPDIILIDGGKGQLAAAHEALCRFPHEPPLLMSIAKQEELLYVHGRDEPLRLSRHDAALRLLQAVRDEAHRFAQAYHHILRRRKVLGEEKPRSRRK